MSKAIQIRAVVIDEITQETIFDKTWTGKKHKKALQKEAFRAARDYGSSCYIGYQDVGARGWALWEYQPGSKYAEDIWLPTVGKYATRWEQILA